MERKVFPFEKQTVTQRARRRHRAILLVQRGQRAFVRWRRSVSGGTGGNEVCNTKVDGEARTECETNQPEGAEETALCVTPR